MTGIEDAQCDLSEASHSVETALELLASVSADDVQLSNNSELQSLIQRLRVISHDLDESRHRLGHLAY